MAMGTNIKETSACRIVRSKRTTNQSLDIYLAPHLDYTFDDKGYKYRNILST